MALTPEAQRQLSRLPEKVVAAVLEGYGSIARDRWRRPRWAPAAEPASRHRHGRTPARAVRPLSVTLARHSRSSSAAIGPLPCSRYCTSPWL